RSAACALMEESAAPLTSAAANQNARPIICDPPSLFVAEIRKALPGHFRRAQIRRSELGCPTHSPPPRFSKLMAPRQYHALTQRQERRLMQVLAIISHAIRGHDNVIIEKAGVPCR